VTVGGLTLPYQLLTLLEVTRERSRETKTTSHSIRHCTTQTPSACYVHGTQLAIFQLTESRNCTWNDTSEMYSRQVQFSEVYGRISDRCSAPNCTLSLHIYTQTTDRPMGQACERQAGVTWETKRSTNNQSLPTCRRALLHADIPPHRNDITQSNNFTTNSACLLANFTTTTNNYTDDVLINGVFRYSM